MVIEKELFKSLIIYARLWRAAGISVDEGRDCIVENFLEVSLLKWH